MLREYIHSARLYLVENIQASLLSILNNKKKINPQYSLRAFAGELGVSPTYLSLALRGQKKISLKRALEWSLKLKINFVEQHNLAQSALSAAQISPLKISRRYLQPKTFLTKESQLSPFADWRSTAIMDLTLTKDFRSDTLWIANRLGLHPEEVITVIDTLIETDLLKWKSGRYETYILRQNW